MRTVLGVVDHQILAARKSQSRVAGARLGLGGAMGSDEQADVARWFGCLGGIQGELIVLFQQYDHIEFLRRIVKTLEVLDQLGNHCFFPVRGDEDRVHRQFGIGHASGGGMAQPMSSGEFIGFGQQRLQRSYLLFTQGASTGVGGHRLEPGPHHKRHRKSHCEHRKGTNGT